MLVYFSEWLSSFIDIPGINLINYISVRAILAIIISLCLSTFVGNKIIKLLKKKQISDISRDLGLADNNLKKDTPNMGGIIIIICICSTTILLTDITNISIQILLFGMIWLGTIGFIDDYIKIFKKDKSGLSGKVKIVGQLIYGIILTTCILYNPQIKVEREYTPSLNTKEVPANLIKRKINDLDKKYVKVKALITTIPFIKKHEFNYEKLLPHFLRDYSFILYFIIISFIVIATSNAANLTDGLDGMLSGISCIIGAGLAIFAYASSNINVASYLNILYIPYSSEIVIFCIALVGTCLGFLWFNIFPAQIFMGDTGSLCLGGIIASIAILIRKELLIPIFCGIFFVEAFSVILQVGYFKYTKKKYETGKRIFLMSPIHHHYQKKGLHENKVVIRFWIISVLLVVFSLLTLKIR